MNTANTTLNINSIVLKIELKCSTLRCPKGHYPHTFEVEEDNHYVYDESNSEYLFTLCTAAHIHKLTNYLQIYI